MANSKIPEMCYQIYAFDPSLQCGSNGTNFILLALLEVEKTAKNYIFLIIFLLQKTDSIVWDGPWVAISNNRARNQLQTSVMVPLMYFQCIFACYGIWTLQMSLLPCLEFYDFFFKNSHLKIWQSQNSRKYTFIYTESLRLINAVLMVPFSSFCDQ